MLLIDLVIVTIYKFKDAILLLLFILSEFHIPLTNAQLTEFIMDLHVMDYFSLQQYLVEMIEKGFIEYSESKESFYYLITDNGLNTLSFLSDRIPSETSSGLTKAIVLKRKAIYKDAEIFAEYRRINEQEFIAHLRVEELGHTLIDIELNLATNKQAKDVCRRWKENAPEIFAGLIRSLIPEDSDTLEELAELT